MTERELKKLLESSRLNNLKHHVTGVLIYFEGDFLQILEGMPEDVDRIFNKILKDSSHKDITKIVDQHHEERNFPDWLMGFSSINTDLGEKLTGYIALDDLVDNDSDHKAICILKNFIATQKNCGYLLMG